MDRILHVAERASLYAVWAGGGLVIFSAFLVTGDVLFRRFFGMSVTGADEVSGYTFAVATVWALAYTLIHRAHVRVDALYLRFGPRVRAALDLLGLIALGVFVAVVAWHAWHVFESSYVRDARSITPMRTPLWIPQFFWFAGLAVFVLTFALLLLRSLVALFTGDLAALQRCIGARTVDEEVQEELAVSAAVHKGS